MEVISANDDNNAVVERNTIEEIPMEKHPSFIQLAEKQQEQMANTTVTTENNSIPDGGEKESNTSVVHVSINTF